MEFYGFFFFFLHVCPRYLSACCYRNGKLTYPVGFSSNIQTVKTKMKILCHLLLFNLANPLSYLFSIYTVFSPLPHRLQLTHMLHQTICYKYVSRSDLFLTKTCHPVSLACTHSWGPESSRCSGPRKVP